MDATIVGAYNPEACDTESEAMIAKVRIAPMERWCWWYTQYTPRQMKKAAVLPGLTVNIDTGSMRPAKCDPEARMWNVTDESFHRIKDLLGHKWAAWRNRKGGMCEHCGHELRWTHGNSSRKQSTECSNRQIGSTWRKNLREMFTAFRSARVLDQA
jgi:hypothetical protein